MKEYMDDYVSTELPSGNMNKHDPYWDNLPIIHLANKMQKKLADLVEAVFYGTNGEILMKANDIASLAELLASNAKREVNEESR